jgi:hypothetical protein
MSTDLLYASPDLRFAIRRQKAKGQPATTDLYTILNTEVSPNVVKEVVSLGIEVGSGSISEQPDIAVTLSPTLPFSGHLRVGALWNILCARGYVPVTDGTLAASPVNTTLSAAITSRFSRVIPVVDSTGLAAGDDITIGVLVTPGTPTYQDKAEVHTIKAVGTQSGRQTIKIYGSGGTFTLYGNATLSSALAYNINAADLQTALEGLYGTGKVTATAITGGFQVDFISTQGNKYQPLLVADPTNLTGTNKAVIVAEVLPGAAANQVVLAYSLINTFPTGAAVKKMDNTKPYTTWFYHKTPSDPRAADFFTIYLEWDNPVNNNFLLMVDGKADQFNLTTADRAIPGFQAQMLFLDATRQAQYWRAVTLLADPSPIVPQVTRGSVSVLGETMELPTGVNINNTGQVYRDARETLFRQLDLVHTEHALNSSYNGMFAQSLWGKIIFGSLTGETVTDSIPESLFHLNLDSPKTIQSTLTNYSFGVEFPTAQFSNYKVDFNTSNPVTGGMESVKAIQESDQSEQWFYYVVSNNNTDAFSA